MGPSLLGSVLGLYLLGVNTKATNPAEPPAGSFPSLPIPKPPGLLSLRAIDPDHRPSIFCAKMSVEIFCPLKKVELFVFFPGFEKGLDAFWMGAFVREMS